MVQRQKIEPNNFKKIIDAVYAFVDLPPRWDGEGAPKITFSAIKRAICLLFALEEANLLIEEHSSWLYITKYSPITSEINSDNDEDEQQFPAVKFYGMSICPSPDGGIAFDWSCHIAWTTVYIPPDVNGGIKYEGGYIEEKVSSPEWVTCDRGETFDYQEVVKAVYSNYAHCC